VTSETDLFIGSLAVVPLSELRFTASRSSGPGGQHVNKTSSRMSLSFDIDASSGLDPWQKRRLHQQLPTRISREGILSMHAQKHRSQSANRELLIARFVEMLEAALTPPKRRRKTRPSRSSVERRLEEKKRRSRVKRRRSGGIGSEE